MIRTLAAALLTLATFAGTLPKTRAELPTTGIFSQTNLVAWCIVPFDTRKRTPAQRAEMLASLGIHRLAYDWRNEHIPTFDTEVAELAKRRIELTAWWFPSNLGAEARAILDCLTRHKLSPQLWVTLGTEPEPDPARLERKITDTVQTLAPICAEAARIGSTVGLYNHLGWFGEPTNQLTLLRRLRDAGHTNAGIVYNFHHGHAQIDRFPELLAAMKPHLLAINLNGMVRNGDQQGKKIIPLGSGDLELSLLQTLQKSGWHGPVGILGHTEEDAEVKLRKELSGLAKLAPLLGEPQPAQPARQVNRDEPWKQQEGDWVDDRWNRTTLARWQAYYLPTPTGTVRKGLAIRVGDDSEGAVCYDTATGNWRLAWTGGFLKFDPARFGLINPPRPDGPTHFAVAEKLGWSGGAYRWHRFAIQDERVALEYSVGGLRIRESPWAARVGDNVIFSRDLEIAPSDSVQASLTLFEGSTTQVVDGDVNRSPWFGFQNGDELTAVLLDLQPGLQISRPGLQTVELTILPRDRPLKTRLLFYHGKRAGMDTILGSVRKIGRFPPFDRIFTNGPAPASAPIVVKGQLGSPNDAYAIDTLPVPYDNPTHSMMFCSGVGFFDNGDAAVATIHGDVWRVGGLDDKLERVEWRRIATGLFQPLGLTVVSNVPVVLCRDHLTRLHDHNGDGVTDEYESLSAGIETSGGGHDYVTSLSRDDAGNFYYVDPKGAHRISPDGSRHHTLARGFRNPNGMGVSPDGKIVLVAPQQGEWTPSSVIHELRQDGWYGYGGPKVTPDRPLGYDLPLCWIPHRIDNSSGSQVWATSDRFGPLSSQILHLSWGRCSMLLTLRDVVDGVAQGAVVPLKGRFLSGPTRGAFSPRDGQLYVVGCQGWQTAGAKDGSFQRVRWTGKRLALPVGWKAATGRLQISFNEPLDRETVVDPGSYSVEAWNYRYAAQYGSKDWSIKNANQEGHDTWTVKCAQLGADGRTVTLEIPELGPAMQFAVKFNLDTAARTPAAGELYGTIHKLRKELP